MQIVNSRKTHWCHTLFRVKWGRGVIFSFFHARNLLRRATESLKLRLDILSLFPLQLSSLGADCDVYHRIRTAGYSIGSRDNACKVHVDMQLHRPIRFDAHHTYVHRLKALTALLVVIFLTMPALPFLYWSCDNSACIVLPGFPSSFTFCIALLGVLHFRALLMTLVV